MKKTLGPILLAVLWGSWALIVFIFHYGTLTPPKIDPKKLSGSAQWVARTAEQQIQHLILTGDPYTRGLKAGELTKQLLFRQEQDLLGVFQKIFRYKPVVYALELLLIPIFKGVENVIPDRYLLEMYGVSRSTDKEFDSYIDAFTRQLAYHGLHEVGQMMVDQVQDDRLENMGCTALVAPFGKSFVIGRTFDFEGSPILDEEKIMKWVFPSEGFAFVSVIWAGMVGAVTGVNEKGLYISLNAANSEVFNRHGLPSTLLLTQVLETADTADKAIEVIRSTPMMISEIFLVADSKTGKIYRIEKSPDHTAVLAITAPVSLTNHLIDGYWKNDKVNTFRRESLTSHYRAARADQLLSRLKITTSNELEPQLLKIMRDKKALDDQPLPLGNRRAINPMVANHGVVFNGETQTLFVSRGPHLNQSFEGYDLPASFAKRQPVLVRTLPADEELTPGQYHDSRNFDFILQVARKNLRQKNKDDFIHAIKEAQNLIDKDPRLENVQFNELQAQFAQQSGDLREAKVFVQKALNLKPAYKRDEKRLQEMLK